MFQSLILAVYVVISADKSHSSQLAIFDIPLLETYMCNACISAAIYHSSP